jgi:uncharacterized RDD family membrane protein YckC
MSAYQYPASAPAAPYAMDAATDPTAVMGRRICAWIVDLLLFLLLSSFFGPTPLSPLAQYVEVPSGVHNACGTLQDNGDAAGCIEIGDRAYFTSEGDAVIQFLVSLAWFLLIYGVLQGLKGVTPGKALFGVQVVDRQGQPPGVGRSLLRSILWLVDGAPWCFPLVGLITAMATKGHRRVGDMVANTLVVGKAYAGRPVVVPGLTAPQGPAGWAPGGYGAPPPGWPQPGYPSGQQPPGQPWGAPPPAPGWAPPPAAPTDAPSPMASPYAPPGGPTPAPSPYAPPGEPTTPPPGASGETPAASPYAPPGGPSAPPSGETGAASPSPSGETPARSPFAMPPASGESPDAAAPESAVGDVHEPGSAGTAGGAIDSPGSAGTAGGAIDSPGSAGTAEPTGAQPAPGADATEVQPGATDATEAQPGATDATEVQRGAGERTEVQPAADPTEVQSGGQGGGYNPQWDAARNTYIVWEPNQGRWLGWDDTTKEWKPL